MNFPMSYSMRNMRHGYAGLLQMVREFGDPVTVRDQPTRELLDVVVRLDDPTDALPTGTNRRLKLPIGSVEALQLIAGQSWPNLQAKAGGEFMASLREGEVYHGGYGGRVRSQLTAVVDRLKADPQSRQALITIWDPLQDLFVPDSKDYPCTVMLQFLIRDDKLQLHTTMRSNDAWLGVAYDFFMFTQLQLTVANVLDLEPGPYFHHAVSFHMYDRDFEASTKVVVNEEAPDEYRPKGLFGNTMYEAMGLARAILAGGEMPRWVNAWDRTTISSVGWHERAIATLR